MKQQLFLVALTILLPGCFKRQLHLRTKAQADLQELPMGFKRGSSFAITSSRLAEEHKQQHDLQTKEIERKLTLALEDKGYAVKPLNQADYALMCTYGAEAHEYTTQELKKLPDRAVTDGNKTVLVSGGYTYVPEQCIRYYKYLTLTAYYANEIKQHKAGAPLPHSLWYGTTSCEDGYSNFRTDVDFLIVEMVRNFGKDFQEPLTATISADNPCVQQLRAHYYMQ